MTRAELISILIQMLTQHKHRRNPMLQAVEEIALAGATADFIIRTSAEETARVMAEAEMCAEAQMNGVKA